jgi:hypothetical protein
MIKELNAPQSKTIGFDTEKLEFIAKFHGLKGSSEDQLAAVVEMAVKLLYNLSVLESRGYTFLILNDDVKSRVTPNLCAAHSEELSRLLVTPLGDMHSVNDNSDARKCLVCCGEAYSIAVVPIDKDVDEEIKEDLLC